MPTCHPSIGRPSRIGLPTCRLVADLPTCHPLHILDMYMYMHMYIYIYMHIPHFLARTALSESLLAPPTHQSLVSVPPTHQSLVSVHRHINPWCRFHRYINPWRRLHRHISPWCRFADTSIAGAGSPTYQSLASVPPVHNLVYGTCSCQGDDFGDDVGSSGL